MKPEAIIWMLTMHFSITTATLYFFFKIYKADKEIKTEKE